LIPVNSPEQQLLIRFYSLRATFDYHHVRQIRSQVLVSDQAQPTEMQLLSVHCYFKLQLGLQWNSLNPEQCHLAVFVKVALVFPFHLGLFFSGSQLLLFVASQVVLQALCNNPLDFLLALRRVLNGFFGHYSQVVGHCDARGRHRQQAK
jgi:hypothetical protein